MYDLPIRFYYYFARFLILFSLKPEPHGNKYFVYYMGLVFLAHHLNRSVILLLSTEPILLLTEQTAAIALKAVEFFYIFLLCLAIFLCISKNVRTMYSNIQNQLSSILKKKKQEILFFNGTVSAFTWFSYCSLNITAIFTLYFTRKSLDDWKTVFDILEYMFCSGIEIAFVGYFLSLGFIVRQTLARVSDNLGEENLSQVDEKKWEAVLNRIKTRFSVACEFYKMLSSNFQTNGVVYIIWLIACVVSSSLCLYWYGKSYTFEFIVWWSFLPMKGLTVIFLCFTISREAKKIFVQLMDLLPRNPTNGEICVEVQGLPQKSDIPKFFTLDFKFLLSILFLIVLYVAAAYAAITSFDPTGLNVSGLQNSTSTNSSSFKIFI